MHKVRLLGDADATRDFNDTVVTIWLEMWSKKSTLGSAGRHRPEQMIACSYCSVFPSSNSLCECRVHGLGEANASGGYYDTMVYYEAGDVAEAEAGQRRRALDSITCMSLMLNSFVYDGCMLQTVHACAGCACGTVWKQERLLATWRFI